MQKWVHSFYNNGALSGTIYIRRAMNGSADAQTPLDAKTIIEAHNADITEAERIIAEKDAEIRRLKEQLDKYKDTCKHYDCNPNCPEWNKCRP